MKSVSIALFAGIVACSLGAQVLGAEAVQESVVYSFGAIPDGQYPESDVIEVRGILYGATLGGGPNACRISNCGTVYSVNLSTGKEKVLHSFGSGSDGTHPVSRLLPLKGTLYGTTENGGAVSCSDEDGCGTVFGVNLSTNAETVIHSFGGTGDGEVPLAGMIDVSGTLYGTTAGGGNICCGTVFSLDPQTGAENVVYSFGSGIGGKNPYASLVAASGVLYGTTAFGGRTLCARGSGCGTAFALDPDTGKETWRHDFAPRLGSNPYANLIDVNGTLYGTTSNGGENCQSGDGRKACGAIFALNPATGAETLLYSFCGKPSCQDGFEPQAGLVAVNGTLYGTALFGGTGGGTVFALDLNTGAETTLYTFCSQSRCADGQFPSGLIYRRGTLYGTTETGGANLYGAVFAVTP